MSTESLKESLNPQILAEASEWLVEFEAGEVDLKARQNFDSWLRQSPENVRAYLGLLPIWKQGALARFTRHDGPEALIAYARTETNVVPLDNHERMGSGSRSRSRTRLAMAAAVLLAILGVFLTWRGTDGSAAYSTGIGEQHSVLLPDGSTLELNARSKVRTSFTDRQRAIELLDGQALFRVAPDPARPFVVNIGDTHVRAVGTEFDVNKKAAGTVVTVVEGRVSVLSRDKRSLLSAGEQVMVISVLPQQALNPKRADPAIATAWTQRRLVFDASSLAEVVEEFNRYNKRPLTIVDSTLYGFPITGSFSSANPASLIRFLEAQPEIQVTAADDAIRIAARK